MHVPMIEEEKEEHVGGLFHSFGSGLEPEQQQAPQIQISTNMQPYQNQLLSAVSINDI